MKKQKINILNKFKQRIFKQIQNDKYIEDRNCSTEFTLKHFNVKRRKLIIGLSSFAVSSLFISKKLLGTELIQPDNNTKRQPISPPGTISADNLHKYCTACHLCVSRCPQKIIKPAGLEYGLKGIMQPRLDYNDGYCRFNCIECAKVCPNGAIRRYEEVVHNHRNHNEIDVIKVKQHIQIGIAKFNSSLCQVNSLGINCGKCALDCPTKAITMIKNIKNNLLIPSIDINKCIGCGICEYYCPTSIEKKAIWVDGLKIHKRINT
jgi:ferredoxin